MVKEICQSCFSHIAEDNRIVLGNASGITRCEKCYVPPKEARDHDPVNHPKHYTNHPSGVECITVTEHFNFNVGNAIKYLWRSDHKNGLEDLKKAAWYINREIQRRENASESGAAKKV